MIISILILFVTNLNYISIKELTVISIIIIITNLFLYEIKDKFLREEKYKN